MEVDKRIEKHLDELERRRKKRKFKNQLQKESKEIALDLKCEEMLKLSEVLKADGEPEKNVPKINTDYVNLLERRFNSENLGDRLEEVENVFLEAQNRSEEIENRSEEIENRSEKVSDESLDETDEIFLNLNNSDCDVLSDDNPLEENIKDFLRSWYFETKIPLTHLSSLLKGLKKWHPELPQTARTLLETPREVNVEKMGSGEFHHFGLKKGIEANLSNCNLDEISLNFNVDGLPLFKSSNKQFWPLLCDFKFSKGSPFIVSLFCGNSKPPLEDFLKPFVDELEKLLEEGLFLQGKNIKVKIRCFICDAPAKAFIKCVKNHNGFYGCDKCCQRGERYNHRTIFPDTASELRTDNSFLHQAQEEHHLGVSPLMKLNIGMITSFPNDPMHLVYLGVVRRLLYTWNGKGSSHLGKIKVNDRLKLNEMLVGARQYWPTDFVRQPRSLLELDHWKATELRQFILYLGPVLLKQVLSDEYYSHFLLLYFGIFILNSQHYYKYIDFSRSCLKQFVEKSSKLYGNEFLIYNVHSLLHLPDDVKRLGPLHSFSAFPFENFLGSMKTVLKKPNHPLQQIVKRMKEAEINEQKAFAKIRNNSEIFVAQRLTKSLNLPTAGLDGKSYKTIVNYKMLLSLNGRDIIAILKSGEVFKINNFIEVNLKLMAIGQIFREKISFLKQPVVNLEEMFIFQVSKLSKKNYAIPVADIKTKGFLLPYKENFICIAISHIE